MCLGAFLSEVKMLKENPFSILTRFEKCLWAVSLVVVLLSCLLSGEDGLLSGIASAIGVTALIFLARGRVLGQVLVVVFSVFYGIISFYFKYYGEMITYLGMTAPIALFSIFTWLKNPYKNSSEVKVASLTKTQILVCILGAVISTAAFYFILGALGNANLIISTLSVTTSFIAAYLSLCRSPYYAVGYATNDMVLIVLWVMAAVTDISCLPMVFCFVMFLLNDAYGFIAWKKMKKKQEE